MALALLPRDKVETAFKHLADNHPQSINDLFDYVEDFWMEKMPIDSWNVFDLKIRTNNNAGGKLSSEHLFLSKNGLLRLAQ